MPRGQNFKAVKAQVSHIEAYIGIAVVLAAGFLIYNEFGEVQSAIQSEKQSEINQANECAAKYTTNCTTENFASNVKSCLELAECVGDPFSDFQEIYGGLAKTLKGNAIMILAAVTSIVVLISKVKQR